MRNALKEPKILVNNSKIMTMTVIKYDITCLDSLTSNSQSPAKWQKTFGLADVSKGHFPHRFNRPENWNKILPYPDKEEFGHARLKAKERTEFDPRYEQDRRAKNGQYNFREEFASYCSMDVTVLQKGCLLFRELFMDISDAMCPFSAAVTITGLSSTY
jgi:hypothetical protein